MLFNSYGFLLVFLPIIVFGFFIVGRRSSFWAASWLGFGSVVFYAWWDYRYVPLLIGSIVFNYWCSSRIVFSASVAKKRLLAFGIATDLVLLGYFKYADFFLASVNSVSNLNLGLLGVVLPIGISFFTFTQIAFLVDTYQGKVLERRFVHYVLFVTYFPHLIAGPVLHHKEMMPQFGDSRIYRPAAENFTVGLAAFTLGLAKKVLLADNLAPYAVGLFDKSSAPSLLVAWGGVLAYTFQLYFDFSGYSDMAIGLSRIFGVKLPLNFNSPYKAASIAEFWRCWHMTLSRFLRDYLYIPLGGNRLGTHRRHLNLFVTMLLGGLWHGAGANFVIWGALHGIYLGLHQVWTNVRHRFRLSVDSAGWHFIARLLTFLSICFAWVFFRAADLTIAMPILQGMLCQYGVTLPYVQDLRVGMEVTRGLGLESPFFVQDAVGHFWNWIWVTVAALIAFKAPNSQEFIARHLARDHNSLELGGTSVATGAVLSRPIAVYFGVLLGLSLMSLSRPTEFLYFNF